MIDTFFVNSILKDKNITGEIFYTRYLDHSKEKTAFLKQYFGNDPERWLSYYMPLCAFHDNWINITKQSFMPLADSGNHTSTWIRENMGYCPSKLNTKINLSNSAVEQK